MPIHLRQGSTIEEFHAYNAKMQATHPLTMTTLSTHDTKRSDDVRARMAVLSETPEEFACTPSNRWSDNTARSYRAEFLDKGTEYFYYQTLIAAWPISPDRMKAYMQKAMREAKEQTTWVANNKEYEDAVNSFIDGTLADSNFVAEVEAFVDGIRRAGWMNSLSQTLLKSPLPVCPISTRVRRSGTSAWSIPTTAARSTTIFAARSAEGVHGQALSQQMMQRIDDGLPKLWTIHRGLTLRRETS